MGSINLDIETTPTITDSRIDKIKLIFQQFDLNRDGGLNRYEMAALVVAVNPRVKFSDDQIHAINDEVFRTYAPFIDGEKGLTLGGLLSTYEDGAGDVDRDFDALGLELKNQDPAASAAAGSSTIYQRVKEQEPGWTNKEREWAVLLNHSIAFHGTYRLLDDLDILIHKLKTPKDGKNKKYTSNSYKLSHSNVSRSKKVVWEESGRNYAVFTKDLGVLRSRADKDCWQEEAFDRHMAIGRVLYHYHLYNEALISFRRALELQRTNVVARFRAGNCLYELGRQGDAKEEFLQALVDAEEAGVRDWEYLLPQLYVNLGIVLENEGMVLNACEHYREAAILCPTHFKALKQLGSALIAVGEYRAGVMALEEAVFLKKDYVDAYYDLALALHVMGDEARAIIEFHKVLELKPQHVDALYNLGELFMDMGRYLIASEMFTQVLAESPNHWKAQLSKAVSLFCIDESEEAKKALKEGLKTVNRVELHDRIAYLKEKRRLKGNVDGIDLIGDEDYIIVEPSKFKTAEENTTLRLELANALDIRAFQNITGLNGCDVELIKKQMNENPLQVSYSGSNFAEIRSIRKVSLEGILRQLLSFLKPETFVGAVKAISEKIFSVLDNCESGRVDLGLFFAVVAALCRGPPDRRKRVAYHALLSPPGNEGTTKITRIDAQRYIKLLRAIYIPSVGGSEILELQEETDTSMVSLTEFLAFFDDPDGGFGIMSTLLKLELGDRNGSYVCATCRFTIMGPRYKEMRSNFSLCSLCYSEGRVPLACRQEEYIFKEHAN